MWGYERSALIDLADFTTSPAPIEPIAEIAAGTKSARSRKRLVWPTENHQCNLPSAQVLLIRNVLVDGDQNIKTGVFGSIQETPVLQTRQIGEVGGVAIVAGEQKAQPAHRYIRRPEAS